MPEILCALGPASLNDRVIARLEDLGVNLFRINLSHTKIDDLPRIVDYIRGRSAVPVCLDTEGAQIRTGDIAQKEIILRENSVVHICRACAWRCLQLQFVSRGQRRPTRNWRLHQH
jgi:pyruvate kinase